MHQRKNTTLIQSLLLATLLSNILIVSACSAESSNTPILSNQSTPAEIYELGLAYYEGNSVPQDYEKSFSLFKRAADQDYAPAKYDLGTMYYEGIGVEQDYKKAMQWYLLGVMVYRRIMIKLLSGIKRQQIKAIKKPVIASVNWS